MFAYKLGNLDQSVAKDFLKLFLIKSKSIHKFLLNFSYVRQIVIKLAEKFNFNTDFVIVSHLNILWYLR